MVALYEDELHRLKKPLLQQVIAEVGAENTECHESY
jgi:hypothetical protein